MKAFVFPGQGAQFVGMGKDLYEGNAQAKEMFEKANEVLGFRITDLMFNGTEDDLKQTKVTQPAVFLHSVILAKTMGEAFKPDMVAGHSLGGYVALAFADNYSYMLQGLALLHSHAMADDASKRTQRDEVCRQVHLNRAGFIVDFITNLFDDSKREYLAQDIKELRDQCLETREEGILAAQRGMKLRTSRIRTLANLDIPVLFVYGKNDTRIPIEMGLSQAMVPKRSEVLLLDNVAHMSFMEDRDYVKTRLCHFVNQCYGCNK